MKWIKIIILISFSAPFFLAAQSQNDGPFRIEIQAPEEVYPYDIINLKERGLIVYFENESVSKTEINWRFIHFDAFFKKRWVADIKLPRNMEPKATFSDSSRIALLFKYEGKRSIEAKHKLVCLNLKDTVKSIFDVPFDREQTPNLLYAMNDRAFFSYYENDKEHFHLLKYADGKIETISFPNVEKGYLQFIKPIPGSSQLMLGLRNDLSKKENQLILFRMSIDGLIVSSFVTPTDDETFINQATAVQLNSDTLMIFGSYILKKQIASNLFTPKNEINTGVFSARYHNQQIDSAKCFNFSHHRTIFKYLSSKEQERQRKKVESQDNLGEAISLNLQLLLHEPLVGDSCIAFLTEAYYPEYRTEENVNYDFYGRPFPNSRVYFEGYRYTNALISGFDLNGNLIWDNNFSMNEMISYDLKPRIALHFDSSNVVMGYSYDGNVNTMVINGYTVVQNPERWRIEAMNASDFIIRTEKPQLEHWYQNYFLSYGYQRIRSSGKGIKNRDNAFFLNKMVYKE